MGRYRINAANPVGRRINLGSFGGDNGPDLPGFLAEEEQVNAGSPLGNNLAAALKVQRQREADMVSGANPTRFIGGPLPDPAWDAFFGSLQQKTERAADHGLRSRVNLAGNGPGEGIGQLASRNAEGLTEHPLAGMGMAPSVAGLRSAASRINNNAADLYAKRRY